MRKPVLGGLVSSLVFAFGCNDSTGPASHDAADSASSDKTQCDHAPQVLFDPDSGRMTIVSNELSEAIRASLGIRDDEAGTRDATLVFRARVGKAGDDLAALTDEDKPGINIGC